MLLAPPPVVLLITNSLLAQTDPSGKHSLELVTDRPDQTESSVVVPPGYFQLETGWGLARKGEENTHEFPTTLLRIRNHPFRGTAVRLQWRHLGAG